MRKCEYCETDNKFTETGLSIISKPYLQVYIARQPLSDKFYLVASEYKELKNIPEQYSNAPFRGDKEEIDFCPKCGRNLHDSTEDI